VDFYIPRYNMVLEVNGPWHYVYNLENEENNPAIFNGENYFK